eukprot:TRINITY_DN356_c0_g1_i1.p1 TRINITY_DN356_c0_g1~~TRINITY_DN356_c0_g1_i1.p1  ORF type:complete len:592 (+),score=164.92 TRINITY_DN356_c0_g1_i1:19-1794(+)
MPMTDASSTATVTAAAATETVPTQPAPAMETSALAANEAPELDGGAPLGAAMRAAQEGNVKELVRLVEAGCRPDQPDEQGVTALHVACLKGLANVLEYLLSKGGNPNCRDAAGSTPLHKLAVCGLHQSFDAAAHERVTRMLRTLLDRGADPLAANTAGALAFDLMPHRYWPEMETHCPDRIVLNITPRHLPKLIGKGGWQLNNINVQFGVRLRAPQQPRHQQQEGQRQEGAAPAGATSLTILGHKENAEQAKAFIEQLLDQYVKSDAAAAEREDRVKAAASERERVRVEALERERRRQESLDTEAILPVPPEKFCILRQCEAQMRQQYDVDLVFPSQDDEEEGRRSVVVRGTAENVPLAVKDLLRLASGKVPRQPQKAKSPPPQQPAVLRNGAQQQVVLTSAPFRVVRTLAPAAAAGLKRPKTKFDKRNDLVRTRFNTREEIAQKNSELLELEQRYMKVQQKLKAGSSTTPRQQLQDGAAKAKAEAAPPAGTPPAKAEGESKHEPSPAGTPPAKAEGGAPGGTRVEGKGPHKAKARKETSPSKDVAATAKAGDTDAERDRYVQENQRLEAEMRRMRETLEQLQRQLQQQAQ